MASEKQIFEQYGKTYKPGELICKEGDEGKTMYIIQKGEIKITKKVEDNEKTLVVLEGGDFFGEMAVIDHGKRSASAVALSEATVIELDEKLFEVHMQSNPKIVKKILKGLSARLRDANQQIENLLLKDNNRRIANQFLSLVQKQGIKVDKGIGLKFAFGSKELSDMVGLDLIIVEKIVNKMIRANLLVLDGTNLVVTSEENIHKFINYLEMKKEFGEN